MNFTFYEFFAGGGMARLGLGSKWDCLFANDFCPKKARSYQTNFSDESEFILDDIWNLSACDIPGKADMAWASFPCQDLSLAGNRKGLSARRSGAFWGFWRLMQTLAKEERAPETLVLENVAGLLTSHKGADFQALLHALMDGGYRAGALVIDGAYFTPQSRPRLFIVATKLDIPSKKPPSGCWLNSSLMKAFDQLPARLRENWLWIPLPDPSPRCVGLDRIIEEDLPEDTWHTESETRRLLAQMSPSNVFKLEKATVLAQSRHSPVYGCGYRRTRSEYGKKVQRFEVRFDGLAGCLRTPGGGSSRQFVLSVETDRARTRLLTAREAARLMGIPDSYVLPDRYNEAYHLCGDGVVVNAVKWLSTTVLEPMFQHKREQHGTDKRHPLSAIS